MSLSVVELSTTDRDLLKRIVVLLEALHRSGVLDRYSRIESKVVTT